MELWSLIILKRYRAVSARVVLVDNVYIEKRIAL